LVPKGIRLFLEVAAGIEDVVDRQSLVGKEVADPKEPFSCIQERIGDRIQAEKVFHTYAYVRFIKTDSGWNRFNESFVSCILLQT